MPNDKSTSKTRSQGSHNALLLHQQENMLAFVTQKVRGQEFLDRPAAQRPAALQIQRKIESLNSLWSECEKMHRTLLTMSEVPDVATYLSDGGFGTARRDFYILIEELEGLLAMTGPPSAGVNVSSGDAAASGANGSANTTQHSSTRQSCPALERIPIPPFDGKLQEWPNFRDMFRAMVVEDTTLDDVFKIAYLRKALKGNALALIRNVGIGDDGFQRAWKLVNDHYQNLNSLTFSYIVRLLKLQPADSRKPGQLERLFIETRETVASLRGLKEPVDQWSSLLVVMTVLRLDNDLRRDWEHSLGNKNTFPTFTELETFLQTRIHTDAISSVNPAITSQATSAYPSKAANFAKTGEQKTKYNSHVSINASNACSICSNVSHRAHSCPEFLKLDSASRFNKMKESRLCANCLVKGHLPRVCPNAGRCSKCQRRHHSILHDSFANRTRDSNAQPAPADAQSTQVSSHAATQVAGLNLNRFKASGNVLLATAIVSISNHEGEEVTTRILLDQGSERSFISEHAAQRLRLKRHPVSASISGIGNSNPGHVNHSSLIRVTSLDKQHSLDVNCLILPKLTSYAPCNYVQKGMWYHVNHLPLADAELQSSRPIDVILGADVYGSIIRDGIVRFPREPVAQSTIFGWVLTGPVFNNDNFDESAANASQVISSIHVTSHDALAESISRFWELEDTPPVHSLTIDEQKCEDLFLDTTTRDDAGRYIVNLPFVNGPPLDIGDSLDIASKQYARLERRLARDSELDRHYNEFLREYLEMGHMSPYTPRSDNAQECYLPHHPVVRESSSTTKVRVVFNASCQSSNGRSLNDNLLTGPKLQQDLSAIILRWRLHRYVMIADVEKMFRQIRVIPEHAAYQIILWRPSVNSPVKPYQLDTVTYGTACAPYLSLRVLYQLASDEATEFPLAASALRENTYVDDLVFGASSVEHALLIRDEILQATKRGGFSFRKWIANDPALVEGLPAELRDNATNKQFVIDETKRVLGISWRTTSDCFEYSVVPDSPTILTKRAILSVIAKLFDPLGWIAPVIIVAKIFMQQLWLEKLNWDEPISASLASKWCQFSDALSQLTNVRISRWLGSSPNSPMQLHVFCDASQHAYAAVIYLRIENGNEVITQLLVSKTKVAPLKTVTIPRLELCAAELGSRLLVWALSSLGNSEISSHAWSDSSVTLSWLKSSPNRWKVFVGNRVSRIQTRCPDVPWHYVPTETNPADVASRGCSALELPDLDLWWHGPSWLRMPSDRWPSANPDPDQNADSEARVLCTHVATDNSSDYASRCSDLSRLIRSAAIFLRYMEILRRKARRETTDDLISPSAEDLFHFRERARVFWLRSAQQTCFASELANVRDKIALPRRNRLISLCPYLDSNGLLRVGGRLEHAALLEEEKHPIVLSNCHVTKLIIRHAHLRTLHGGIALTSRLLAEEYWIFRVKSAVKSEIRRCVTCVRYRATTLSQAMAPLPSLRVNRRRAFDHVGVDYAGPVMVKFGSGRGHQAHKAYIAVFVCMITRAIHLELVHAYSTDAFLAAFKRFSARRGLPTLVISDNGTNFNGASRELGREFAKAMHHPAIASTLALERIEWRFIPPGSPHFGGMWEAGVKSVKHHLRRVAGDHTLGVEEFNTLLCQIEACLNSRPIAGLSNNLDDLSYLTPGHFLIGTALVAPPEPSLLKLQESRLSRWQTVQVLTERFWKIWSKDFLKSMQTRVKWRTPQPNIETGAIVLLKDENLPPAKWALGRVTSCQTGSDGLVRVCHIRTALTTLTRPIHKLCLLPVELNESSDD